MSIYIIGLLIIAFLLDMFLVRDKIKDIKSFITQATYTLLFGCVVFILTSIVISL